MHSFQDGFCKCFANIYQSENCSQKPRLQHVFFKLVSAKCLKTYAKCINFKTVFANVLQAFTKVKISLKKNDVFSTVFFYFKLSPQSVSKRMQNAFTSKRFSPSFARIYQSENCSQKRQFLALFFLNLSPQSVSKRKQNELISRRFSLVFSTHLPKLNFFLFLSCLHKVSQNACKMHCFQNGFCPCFARIY